MNSIKSYLNTTCSITGKSVRLIANCPKLHLKQVARYAATGSDAVYIAEERYKLALVKRAGRSLKQHRKRVQAFEYNSLGV